MSMQIVLQTELFPRESVHHSDYAINKRHEKIAEENSENRKHKGAQAKDLTGNRYGMLVIEEMTNERSHAQVVFIARCDCGSVIKVTSSHIRHRTNKEGLSHCGCMGVHKNHISAPGTLGLGGFNGGTRISPNPQRAFVMLHANYREAAKNRGIKWDLTKEQFYQLTQGDCLYCGVKPSQVYSHKEPHKFIYNGIDRVDSGQGYSPTNCVSCCGLCNIGKMDHSVDEFLEWVERVHTHQMKINTCR